MDWRSELASKIIFQMKRFGINGAKPFAKKCGVSDTLIRHILDGTGNPGIGKLEKIADECGVPIFDILPTGSEEALNNKPTSKLVDLKTSNHMQDISGWIFERQKNKSTNQYEYIKGHLEEHFPDFAEYLKKRRGENHQNGTDGAVSTG